ncbi:transmembrane protein 184C [Hyalella azteca]|uniref:Transmembrane protein 184C n=1 Tax=Hyalella azteca TaxID=294128 RepID=A0A8B7PAA6_HYAAZ|nr:transmembrane protein 184C [Hyalella azteca]
MCGCSSCHNLCSRWRLWIRPLVFFVYAAVILGVLPYVIYKMVQDGVDKFQFAWLVGGLFVFITIPISLWQITHHLVNYTKPKLQKHIIRILWLVPVYSLDSWLVLRFPSLGLYLDTARECYEAYAIYNFMMFLLQFLDQMVELDVVLDLKPQTKHFFPLCCLKTWPMGREFIHRCKHGILQYTVFHLITTGLAFVCGLANIYEEGNFSPTNAFVYLFVINNVSQFVAMYCLVLFYKAMKDELQPMAPLAKFLCIKCVVFFSFFQGVAIMFLAKLDVIKEVFDNDDLQRISNVLQNFLICIEMFIAAVAHHFAFSYKPYIDSDFEGSHCCTAFLLIWDVSDVRSDIREHVSVVREGVKRHLTGHHSRSRGSDSEGIASWGSFSRSSSGGDERTRLLVPTPSHHTVYCATEAPTASPHCTLMPGEDSDSDGAPEM